MKIKDKLLSCLGFKKSMPVDAYSFLDDEENFQKIPPFSKDAQDKKIVIYTCITGGYDNLQEPTFTKANITYIAFSDSDSLSSKIWDVRQIPESLKGKSNAYINRYIKMHANELFPNADYAIYIDGSVKITSDISSSLALINPNIGLATFRHCLRDCLFEEAKACLVLKKGNLKYIKKQISLYEKEGLPHHFGLFECTLLFIKIGENSKKLFDAWWSELCRSKSGRDQLALPYVVWKLKIDPKQIAVVGTNVWKSSRFTTSKHN